MTVSYLLLGGKLIFLPPYSPNYNPIEYSFSSIKAWLQHHYKEDIDKEAPILFLYQAYGWFKCVA
ncbi:hypothetical protein BS47DRAFT_1292255 [Hydnum rufescens UP504]|uniref:Tc1-like transposase DDE domain-containing protein n=1 Tax=Hydnum rufescens UP504 TaxID=1448309 RepID=A0A9P6B313_9AGAM|nr:hypothetical protein BS47DRAFT_1292255 [Hydnum rufescens UP504]